MTDTNKQKSDVHKGGVNPIAAAVVGAVVGAAAVGIAGVAALSNKKNRKKIEQAIDDTKEKVDEVKGTVTEKVSQGQEKAKNMITAVKTAADKVVKTVK